MLTLMQGRPKVERASNGEEAFVTFSLGDMLVVFYAEAARNFGNDLIAAAAARELPAIPAPKRPAPRKRAP